MERIAIYGIGGLYNYGCEAIIRGTVTFIRKRYPDSEITYYSRHYYYDKKQIADLDIVVKDIGKVPTIWRRVISKIIDISQIPIVPFLQKEFQQIINESDIIFSVGGDIYSVPAYLRSKNKYRYVNAMVEFGKLAKQYKKTVIIYGASIGPFGDYDKARKYYLEHLQEVDEIYCREHNSIAYLDKMGININVNFSPDPAFLIDYNTKLDFNADYIGVNLSELAFKELYGEVSDKTMSGVCKILAEISQKLNMPLMLIPHVFSPTTECDNDYIFLEKIYNQLKNTWRIEVLLVKSEGFIDAKSYLSQCRFVICARMHCAVNAVTIGVPAIFLSYSIKSRGMASFIYGDEHWMLPLNKIYDELVPLATEMNEQASEIKSCIHLKLKSIHDLYK